MFGIKTSLLLVFAFGIFCHANGAGEKPIGVTVKELLKLIRSGAVTIIDVRERWELETEGKIAGSINIQSWALKYALRLPPSLFKVRYGIAKPAKDNCNLIFHCKSGGRSLKAVTMARTMGWSCSRHLFGGFDAWKKYFN